MQCQKSKKTPLPSLLAGKVAPKQLKRSAKPLAETDFSEADRVKFHSQVKQGTPEECWEWQGTRHSRGYGTFWVRTKGSLFKSHRIALVLSGVVLDPNLEAAHSCDNPPCCNPAHLHQVVHRKNMLEASERKLFRPNPPKGVKSPLAKLTELQVLEIRKQLRGGAKKYQLAKIFKVNRANIQHIAKGKTWAHLLPV